MAEFVTVGTADEIGDGDAKAFEVGGQLVAVARSDGRLFAFSDICTHRPCNLSAGGDITGAVITCEGHGSEFDMGTGEAVDGRAEEPIAPFEVREQDGESQAGD